jgi:hypothetical protein
MDAERKRPRWRKKRWRFAATGLILALSYPLSLAPAMYAAGRGWIGGSIADAFYAPIVHVLNEVESAAKTSEFMVRAEMPDGRIVTSRGRSSDTDMPWWAPAASVVTRRYWAFCTWCGEAGIKHSERG